MGLYLIAPIVPAGADKAEIDARLRVCLEPIVELIMAHLGDDPALFSVRHSHESSKPPLSSTRTYSYADVAEIPDSSTLRRVLAESVDPFSGRWSLVRSLVTCRAVDFGYDGQAFLCVPTESPPVESPDRDLISVEDISQWLLDTDRMDGLLGDEIDA